MIKKSQLGFILNFENGKKVLIKYEESEIDRDTNLESMYNNYITFSQYLYDLFLGCGIGRIVRKDENCKRKYTKLKEKKCQL